MEEGRKDSLALPTPPQAQAVQCSERICLLGGEGEGSVYETFPWNPVLANPAANKTQHPVETHGP